MNFVIFESLPVLVIYIGISLIILFSCELGFQLGKNLHSREEKEATSSIGPMVSGLLGMLAFVLAFTFSMTAAHHSSRKQTVLDEANAIGTAYLRSDLLDTKHKHIIKKLLREYVDMRIRAVEDIRIHGIKAINIDIVLKRSVTIHNLLWTEVSTSAINANSLNTTLMIESLNNVIEMHEKRITAGLRNRIPTSIWIAVLSICILTMITLGTQLGFSGKRRLVAVIPLSMAFSALLVLAVDLNRPEKGLIIVGQQAMINLLSKMDNKLH
mgnify:CR=1 FL=1